MKSIRRLNSGIYFRVKDAESGEFDYLCFEDLTEQQQDDVLKNRSGEWMRSLIKALSMVVKHIKDQVGVIDTDW